MIRLRLRLALVMVALVFLVGTAGYRYIEGWTWLEALWMVLITVTTIGYGEVHELSDEGRWFTLGFMWLMLPIIGVFVFQTPDHPLNRI